MWRIESEKRAKRCAKMAVLNLLVLPIRKEYPQVPPKVKYTLSDKGKTFVPIINAMCGLGRAYPINDS